MEMNGIPTISVVEVAEKRSAGDDFVLLDVRETHELSRANLGDEVVHVPLSKLAQEYMAALPDEMDDTEQEVVVMCHHGNRSAQVVAFLKANGYNNVYNMTGGIDAYAKQVDDSVDTY